MEKKVAVLLAQGFEDAEAIIIIDVLRRLKINVDTLSCQDQQEVISYFNISVKADRLLSAQQHELYDAIVLPGGPQGARNLGSNERVINFVKNHLAASKWVCAICSAGAHVLSANQLLEGRRYTCSGDNYTLYKDGVYVNQPLVEDGNILTGQGLGYAFQFAFDIGARLVNPRIAQEQAEHIYVDIAKHSPTLA